MTTDNYSESLNGSALLGVQHHTADDTLKRGENNTIHTNKGAAGTIVLTLPAAIAGMRFTFVVKAVQELRVDPNGTEIVAVAATGAESAAGKYISADAVGELITLVCAETGKWSVENAVGTWTVES